MAQFAIHSQEGSMRESISISLPEDLKDELDRVTRADGVSRSDVVREAVREYLFVRQFRVLRQRLVPYAEAQGIYTDEDLFREVS
jgi:metal-responsive CopG/Arc/MetJ family transcriptional regulator